MENCMRKSEIVFFIQGGPFYWELICILSLSLDYFNNCYSTRCLLSICSTDEFQVPRYLVNNTSTNTLVPRVPIIFSLVKININNYPFFRMSSETKCKIILHNIQQHPVGLYTWKHFHGSWRLKRSNKGWLLK